MTSEDLVNISMREIEEAKTDLAKQRRRATALDNAVRLHSAALSLDGRGVLQTAHVFEAYLRGDADPMNVEPLPSLREAPAAPKDKGDDT